MSRRGIAIAAGAIAMAIWLVLGAPGVRGRSSSEDLGGGPPSRAAATPAMRAAARAIAGARRGDRTQVAIAGRVIDRDTGKPVGGVEVVLRGAAGDATIASASDGSFHATVPPGVYRAFVRDANVMSVATPDRVRLPASPHADVANIPDDDLLPSITAFVDTANVELPVVRGGSISGRVVTHDGAAVAGAAVVARGGGPRPALATDVAETDRDGRFELRVPAGSYALEAAHPRYAGALPLTIDVTAGATRSVSLVVTAGCLISGRVARADGSAANDGAIELRRATDGEFGPAGRIDADGMFRWTALASEEVTLRAWPWKSPPSRERTFACSDGARFTDVVLQLRDERPDIAGVLVDATGAPVPFAYLDIAPLDVGPAQQERTDALGRWQVYEMPRGRYRIATQAPGRGAVVSVVTAPATDVRLELGGTGRIEGATTELVDGTFEAQLATCGSGPADQVVLAHDARLVAVAGGRFAIDDVPACDLTLIARWRDQAVALRASVIAGDTVHVDLAIGPPRAKTVRGTVRDRDGRAVARASVTAVLRDREAAAARGDDDGRYEVKTWSGAQLVAGDGEHVGTATVSRAAVGEEIVDVVIDRKK